MLYSVSRFTRPVLAGSILLAVFVVFPACAPANGETAQRARGPITQAEIEESGLTGSALNVVRHLRPQWLRTRTDQGVRVYVDDTRAGNSAGTLGTIPIDQVGTIERMSASEATTRYGSGRGGHPEGAILVTTRR